MAEGAFRAALTGYRWVGLLARPLVPLALARRVRQGKEEAARTGERYGEASLPRPAGPLVWVHAASVGETNAVMPLIHRLATGGLSVLFTSTTVTSAAVAARRLPDGAIHQFGPIDIAPYLDRFLAHWQPDLALLVESELWPGTIASLDRTGVPVVIVNGRLSPRTFAGWRRVSAVARGLFSRLSLVLAQSEEDGGRFRALGAANVRISGNLKFDSPVLPADPEEIDRLRSAIAQRPVWVAASTHEGEEAVVAEAHRRLRARYPDLLTIIAPRHPQRGNAVRELLAAKRLSIAQRSRGEPLLREVEVYLADTLGELGLFYRVAPVAFLGGSLIPHGGQNPIEAVRLDAVVLHGPDIHNFAEIYGALDAAAGTRAVTDAASLADGVDAFLTQPRRRAEFTAAANRALAPLAGALDATLLALRPYLPGLQAA